MASYVLIYGPHLSGKTLNAMALAAHYECGLIVDDWRPGAFTPVLEETNVLLLSLSSMCTGLEGHQVRCIPISAARLNIKKAWIEPKQNRKPGEVPPVHPVDAKLDALAMVAVQWHRNRLLGKRPDAIRNTLLAVIADLGKGEVVL